MRMAEFLRAFEDLSKRIYRARTFIFSEDDPSEDVEMLLSPGYIEKLVREGRAPMMVGKIGTFAVGKKPKMRPYYQVPPKGLNPDDIRDVYSSNGVYVFVNKLGVQRIGSTYTLTKEQAKEVDKRVKEESTKLKKSQKDTVSSK